MKCAPRQRDRRNSPSRASLGPFRDFRRHGWTTRSYGQCLSAGRSAAAFVAGGARAHRFLRSLLWFWPGSASAAEITYSSVIGIWHDPVDNLPGSQPGDPVITNGIPTSIIRWGDQQPVRRKAAMTSPRRSRRPSTLPGPIPFFSLGSFTHRNFEVDDPSLTSVELDVVLVISVDGVPRPSIDLHVYVQPRGNPEQPDSLSLSDTARRGVHGPRDDRRVTHAHDVQRRWSRLHVVDELSRTTVIRCPNSSREKAAPSTARASSANSRCRRSRPARRSSRSTKSGPATMNPAEWGDFVLDVRNIGHCPTRST